MADIYRKGYVYIQNIFAGIIKETDEGYVFAYDEKYLDREDTVAASLTLPLEEKEYAEGGVLEAVRGCLFVRRAEGKIKELIGQRIENIA